MSETHRFPCSACGADLRFSPDRAQLVCDHCGHCEPVGLSTAPNAITENDLAAALRNQSQADTEEIRQLACENCGARVEFDPDIHAGECPFCASPMVTDTGAHRQIKPEGVLPFALSERQAHNAMSDWLGKLWFAPNGLAQYARKGRKMDGIYVPFWTYDAQTRSAYSGQRGMIYYVTKTVTRDGKRVQVQEQRIRWTPVRGRVARFFDDVLVLASRSLPKKFTDALAPWDLQALTPYTPQVLAGFRAEGYTVDLQDGLTQARAYMDQVIARDVRFDIGGDRQRINRIDTDVSQVTFKHILLPVWVAAYRYRGKSYRFVVNGRSGKVQGERPYSAWKIALAVLAGLIVAGVFGYLYAVSQGV
jgi:DNA-directed RNA polymerase subunit RPC12/RpoP